MNHPFAQLPLTILILFWFVLRPMKTPRLTTYMELARYQMFIQAIIQAFPEPSQRSRLQAVAIQHIEVWAARERRMIDDLQKTGLLLTGWMPAGK